MAALDRRSFLLGSAAALAVGPQMVKAAIAPVEFTKVELFVDTAVYDRNYKLLAEAIQDACARACGIPARYLAGAPETSMPLYQAAAERDIEAFHRAVRRQIGETLIYG